MEVTATGDDGFVIENVRSGDVFGYRLLLILGRVQGKCDKELSVDVVCGRVRGGTARESATSGEKEKERVVHPNCKQTASLSPGWAPKKWPIVQGHFKVLALLSEGPNTISFSAGRYAHTLKVVYNPAVGANTTGKFVRMVYLVAKGEDGSFQVPNGVPNDLNEAVQRLKLGALLMQTFCAESMKRHGLGRRTFTLEMDDEDGLPKVTIFHSKLTRSEIYELGNKWKDGGQGWSHFHKELGCLPKRDRSIDCAIMSMTKMINSTKKHVKPVEQAISPRKPMEDHVKLSPRDTPRPVKEAEPEEAKERKRDKAKHALQKIKELAVGESDEKAQEKADEVEEKKSEVEERQWWEDVAGDRKLFAHTALGGDRLGLFSSGCLHAWARDLESLQHCLQDSTDMRQQRDCEGNEVMNDSAFRNSYWSNYATTLGATMHEIGHCFGLPHTFHGIMARGFDHFNRFFAMSEPGNAHVLYPHSFSEGSSPGHPEGGAYWDRPSAAFLRHCPYMSRMHMTQRSARNKLEKPTSKEHDGGGGQTKPQPTPAPTPAPKPATGAGKFKGKRKQARPGGKIVEVPFHLLFVEEEGDGLLLRITSVGVPLTFIEYRTDEGNVFWHEEFLDDIKSEQGGDHKRRRADGNSTMQKYEHVVDCALLAARFHEARHVFNTKDTCNSCLVRAQNAAGRTAEHHLTSTTFAGPIRATAWGTRSFWSMSRESKEATTKGVVLMAILQCRNTNMSLTVRYWQPDSTRHATFSTPRTRATHVSCVLKMPLAVLQNIT
eukprot:TRINITY_DN5273_c0_g1_i1.p1 TRINITY_DN5273_c0_g1~~TRINITY_DN5273_c0_g1_i1.p1  ORF type:complete len:784 (-),score=87.02 TRINITY_DN5273_c0_g1_i1:97-2418(-)